jgi:plastocyanin
MKRLLTLLLACTALVAAGCGGDEEEDAAPTGGGAATQEDTGSGRAEPSGEGVKIDMKNFQFVPKAATVKVGQTVTWTNSDSAPHNAVDEKGGAFKSELFNKGETYEFTAKEAGTINYVCTIHPGMEGTLTVTE